MSDPPFELDSATYLWNLAVCADAGLVIPTEISSTTETVIPLLERKDYGVSHDLRVLSDRLDLSLNGNYGEMQSVTQSVARDVLKVLARLGGPGLSRSDR